MTEYSASLVLASASPRRAELLQQMGLRFTVRPVDIDETPRNGELSEDYVCRLAREKALAGLAAVGGEQTRVIGSDTTVELAGQTMLKPEDAKQAVTMLARLSGRTHRVLTAVAVAFAGDCRVELVATRVSFRRLEIPEIEAYVATGEPMDKAGGYGIQGRGGIFVSRIEGSYSAVVGLPLNETSRMLAQTGYPVWRAWSRQRL
ncbi:Maf family protein [Marinobacter sp.]|jgi:septum formation protein|uniref:Maf family protein n=1 Tax=Marinobacter sp. TaxID=50741 RepID=UPI0019B9788D|nr:Maf family protein [Marinobacter sp.]MBC7193576.1 septum formation inhibitor Maf [Marinobacter sp.]